jgi:3-phosphoshikimate 1-carboxyvinyltransferase
VALGTLIGHYMAGPREYARGDAKIFSVARRISPLNRPIHGTLEVPGDKSISHRYGMLAALAEGRSEIANFSTAADCRGTLDCLRRLGVHVEAVREQAANAGEPQSAEAIREGASERIVIDGRGLHGLHRKLRALDAGNSGTTMRLLAGALAGQRFNCKITGDVSLRRRPMRRVIEPLETMGAQIEAREGDFAPLRIRGGPLHATDYTAPFPSSQVKSAILLAGLFADGWTTVHEPLATRDHTELALREFGAEVKHHPGFAAVRGVARLRPQSLRVPGDFSSAAFFIGAVFVHPGSELLISNVGLNPTRTALLDVLAEMGAQPRIVSVDMRAGELVGLVLVRHAELSGGVISGARIPKLIDELPLLAALGPYTEKGTEIRDAGELRVKESDRIKTLAAGLTVLGARVEEFPDGLRVEGRSAGRLRDGSVGAHGDHRIAMALAIAALGASGDTILRDPECVAASFPEFFSLLEGITGGA